MDRYLDIDQYNDSLHTAYVDVEADGQMDIVVGITNSFDESFYASVLIFHNVIRNIEDGPGRPDDARRIGDVEDGPHRSGHQSRFVSIENVDVGDINADGGTDLVVVYSDGMAWLLNESDGFRPQPLGGPKEGDFADVDHDGDLDWITPDFGWLEHDGDLNFIPARPIVERISPTSFKMSDIDGDGDTDFLVSTVDGFRWFRFDGTDEGTHATIAGTVWVDQDLNGVRDASEPGLESVMVFIDLDDDGLAEIGEPSVFTDEDGRFRFADLPEASYTIRQLPPVDTYQVFPRTTGAVIAAHQIELSADIDIEFRNWQTSKPEIQLKVTAVSEIGGTDDKTQLLVSADINADGFSDLVRYSLGRGLHWLPNLGANRGFGSPQQIDIFGEPQPEIVDMQMADMDGDGDMDLLLGTDGLDWYPNLDGRGQFGDTRMPISNFPSPILGLADLDSNGRPDVLTQDFDELVVLWQQSDGQDFKRVSIGGSADVTQFDPQIADLDGDGNLDILWALQLYQGHLGSHDAHLVWQRTEDAEVLSRAIFIGSWNLGGLFVQPIPELRTAAADLDADGDVDVVSAWDDSGQILWFENDGGSFSAVGTPIAPMTKNQQLVDIDMNLDGYVDLFLPDGTWYMNIPHAYSFAPGTTLGLPDSWTFIQTVDLDGDMIDEILGIDNSTDRVIVVRLPSESVFERADFDGDGDITSVDVDMLSFGIRSGNPDFDLNADGIADRRDLDFLIGNLLGTRHGDVNLDGHFDSSDLTLVFQAGEFQDGIENNSSWATGDWNGDGEFNSADLVYVFQLGGFSAGGAILHP